MHSLEEAEEDIYDFSGVSYDLTSLRSELMQFREKGKPRYSDSKSNSDKENGISRRNYNYVLPSSSSILSRSYGTDESRPPKLPPKEKDLNRKNKLHLNPIHTNRSYTMTKNMEDNESDFVDNNVAVNVNKGIGINYQINGIYVNNMANGHENYTNGGGASNEEDDEEWYPPSPPIYDVADKLIEINRMLYEDPSALVRSGPGKLRWKPDSYLVQVRWLYSGGDVCDDDYTEHFFDPDDPEQQDQDLDDYSDDCDHESSPVPASLRSEAPYTNSSTANHMVNSQTLIEDFGRQLNLIPSMSENSYNPSPPILDHYDIDSDEKTVSSNVVSPMPSDKLMNGSNMASDTFNGKNCVSVTKNNENFGYNQQFNVSNGKENTYTINGEERSMNGVISPLQNGQEQGVRISPVNGVYKKDNTLTKSPSPSSQPKENNNDGKSDSVNQRIPSSEEDESLSCRTLNGDNDSNEENLISQRIDLNRRYMEDGRNSTSPSSMSSNLSQHSQSSIINLINNHEAKRAASNSAKGSRRMSSPTSVSVKGPSVPRSNSISNGGLVPSKSSTLSPTKTKTKIMISKTGHSHTKESSSSSSLSQSQQFRPNNKDSNPNIAKKTRGSHREKVLLNGDNESSLSRTHLQKRLSTPSSYSPLPQLYNPSSSSPSSTPPPLPEKTLSNGVTKSHSSYSLSHSQECNNESLHHTTNGRPKPSLSPYTRSRISKTTSDNSIHQTSKFGQQRSLRPSTNISNIQVKSNRTSSLSRPSSGRSTSSSTTSVLGLGRRDSYANRSSALITTSLSSNNENTRPNSIANSKRSNSSGFIELKATTRRRSSITKPPPPPPIMTRAAPSTRPLQRKTSRNSLSSNSSVSSQTTEDTSATTGSSGISSGSHGLTMMSTSSGVSSMSNSSSSSRRRSSNSGLTSTSSTVNGSGYLDTDSSYLKWKVRKREEKRLKERRDYLEGQLRRY